MQANVYPYTSLTTVVGRWVKTIFFSERVRVAYQNEG